MLYQYFVSLKIYHENEMKLEINTLSSDIDKYRRIRTVNEMKN